MASPITERQPIKAGLFVPNSLTAIAFECSNYCFSVREMHRSNYSHRGAADGALPL